MHHKILDRFYLQTLVVLLLLLVDNPQTKVYLVCFFEIRLHTHHLRESLFGMFQRAIAIVQDTNTIPQFGFLLPRLLVIHRGSRVDHLPSDLVDDTKLVDRPHKLVADLPSSGSNALLDALGRDQIFRGSVRVPKLPQTSPLLPSSFSMFCKYSTALGKFSFVLRMLEVAFIAWIECTLCRKA